MNGNPDTRMFDILKQVVYSCVVSQRVACVILKEYEYIGDKKDVREGNIYKWW
jgi:hypothetical protein